MLGRFCFARLGDFGSQLNRRFDYAGTIDTSSRIVGNMHQLTVTTSQPLMEFLLQSLGQPRKNIKNLLKFGAVLVNGQSVSQFDHLLNAGDQVQVGNLRAAAVAKDLQHAQVQIVYEDQWLLVAEKPSGLLTVATDRDKTDTLFFRLSEFLVNRDRSRPERALVVHRLDQGTSGLVLFAKTEQVKKSLQDAWSQVEKIYLAIVEGRPQPPAGVTKSYLIESKSRQVYIHDRASPESKLATTHFRTLQSRGDLSLLEVRIDSGRKHQIRVHLADLGHPVAGDARYGHGSDPCHRLCLHAHQLSFVHPARGEQITFTSPMPGRFAKVFAAKS